MQNPKPSLNFYFINGRGSAGKDVQADHTREGIPNSIRLSTGDIYRGARDQVGEYAKYHDQIAPYVKQTDSGILLPDTVIVPIVQEVIETKMALGLSTFIFTGFPRTIYQLESTDNMLTSLGQNHEVDAKFICVAVLPKHSIERAKKRRETDLAKGETPRKDDEPRNVRKRLKEYKTLVEPMLRRLAQEGRLIIVRADGTIEVTTEIFDKKVEGHSHGKEKE